MRPRQHIHWNHVWLEFLGRKFSQVIGSNQTQQKHWKGLCPNPTQLQALQKYCKTHFNHKLYYVRLGHSQALTSKRRQGKKSGAVMPAGSHAAKPLKPTSMREAQAVWILHITASHFVQNCASIDV